MKLLFASHNLYKVKELKAILPEHFTVLSLHDLDFHEDIIEDANTFEGNAQIKTNVLYEKYGISCIGEDSGLCVDALDGAPGIYSARYAGMEKDDVANNNKLLDAMINEDNRSAHYVSVISFKIDDSQSLLFRGQVHGQITRQPKGVGGFGYDPLFIPDGFHQTFAELDDKIKNSISHRKHSTTQFLEFITTHYGL